MESGVLLSTELPGTAQQVIQAVTSLGLECVIAKRRTSLYTAGDRNTAWVKASIALRRGGPGMCRTGRVVQHVNSFNIIE
jgi:hypothetical protein